MLNHKTFCQLRKQSLQPKSYLSSKVLKSEVVLLQIAETVSPNVSITPVAAVVV